MKNYLITFLLLFLGVQLVNVGSLLPSKVYAEDGYHCGKYIDVQTSFEAENPNILIELIISNNHLEANTHIGKTELILFQFEVFTAQVSLDSYLNRKQPYQHRVREHSLFKSYLEKTFYKGINRLARDGLTEDRVILV